MVTGCGSVGQTSALRSARRRPRSLNVLGWPVIGSDTVVPVRKPDSPASPPKRGEICRKLTPDSNEWQPLQVLSANLCRASLLVMPGENHGVDRSLNTAPARKCSPSNVSGTSCVSVRIDASLALTYAASLSVKLN